RETLDELKERRTELLQRRVVELHLPLDARSLNDAKILARLDRVLEERGFADAGVSEHDEDGSVTVPRGIQQALKHRALALPAEQPPRLSTDDHPGSMLPEVTNYGFPGCDEPAAAATIAPMQPVVFTEYGGRAEMVGVPNPRRLASRCGCIGSQSGVNLIRLRGASTGGCAH
ncbi:MAG: hypothetical protein QOJ93_456, partial [Actinomycetota bacterium]|nr:hypothetical protein [Actinomycetota bacterium]